MLGYNFNSFLYDRKLPTNNRRLCTITNPIYISRIIKRQHFVGFLIKKNINNEKNKIGALGYGNTQKNR